MIIKKAKLFGDLRLLKASYTSYFCTSNQEIKYLRDRALLASNIIRRIWTKNKIDDLSHLPLHQSIVQYLESAKDIDDKARNELLNYFKNGVQLDGSVWYQKSIKDTRQQQTQNLTFYPTKIVTSQIFRRLLSPRFTYRCDKTLITGDFGISKTFSVALFAHLSNMVAEYNFKSYPTRQYLNDNLGIIRAPKVIYYSYLKEHIREDGSLRKIIINQLKSEVPAQKLPGFLNSKKFMEKTNPQESQNIQNFYDQNYVQAILIIDQISEYFSLLRRVRFKQVRNIKIENQTIALFQQKLESFKGGFYQVVYLNSMEVDKDLIVEAELKHNQYQVQMDKIEYGKHLWKEEYMKQIIEIFLYLYEQKFKVNLFQKGPFLESISKKLFEYLSSIRYSYFTNFLYMRQEVKKIAVQQKYAQQSAQNLENNILELFKNVLSSSEQKLAVLFKQFIEKRMMNTHKGIMHQLIFRLYLQAQQEIFSGKIQTGQFKLEINIIDLNQKHRIQIGISNRQIESFNCMIYRQFFEVQQIAWKGQMRSIACKHSANVIVKALQNLFPTSLQFIANQDPDLISEFTKGPGKEQFIKIMMLAVFKMSSSITFFNRVSGIQHENSSITFNNIAKDQIYGFTQMPKDQFETEKINKQQKTRLDHKFIDKSWQFLYSFSPPLSETIKKMNDTKDSPAKQSFVYVPLMKKYPSLKEHLQQIRRVISKSPPEKRRLLDDYYYNCTRRGVAHLINQSTNSKADFIMVQINLQTSLMKINVFDATISQGKETQKLNKFIGQFLRFGDRENDEIEIKLEDNSTKVFKVQLGYHVLCLVSKHDILETLNKNFSESLKFEPVELNINESQNKKDENLINVFPTDKEKNCILKQVGCFDIFNGIKVNGNFTHELNSGCYKVDQLWLRLKQIQKTSQAVMSKQDFIEKEMFERSLKHFLDQQQNIK